MIWNDLRFETPQGWEPKTEKIEATALVKIEK